MISEKPRIRTGGWFLLAIFALAGASLLWIWVALRVPGDSPMARAYRTEATLASLAKAVDTYHERHKTYPPAGQVGLRMATRELSGEANYMPGEPALDAWGMPFQYIPYYDYEAPGVPSVHQHGLYFAPGAYQLYSLGADMKSSREGAGYGRDDVVSWDTNKPWRETYKEQQQTYMQERKAAQ